VPGRAGGYKLPAPTGLAVRRRSFFVSLLAVGVLLGDVRAQEGEPVEATVDRVQLAIADYQAIGRSAANTAQRKKAIVWLGAIDDPATTAFLQAELQAAGDTAFAASVLEAIGKVVRPSLQADVTAVLQRASAPLSVRLAAAAALVRLGDRPLEAMLARVALPGAEVPAAERDAMLTALVDSGLERAHRGLAPLLVAEGPPATRLKLLRRMEVVHGVPPVSAARIKLALEGDLELAAVAWRQLLLEKHERGKALTIDVLERVVGEPRATVAVELIGGLVHVRDPDYYPVLLRFGGIASDLVRGALRAAAPVVAGDAALLKWLITVGLDDAQPSRREAAKLLLQEAPPEAVRPLVERIRADLRAGRKKALELAVGLHSLLAKDPTWRQDLAALAAAPDFENRMHGLALLLELGADAGVTQAQQGLSHRAWEMRSLCLRYLTRCRDVASIPLLIARYGKEEGRLAAELEHALFVHTGTRCFSKREWENWWLKNQTGFALPHADTVRSGGTSSGGNTVVYHDIPIVSNRIAFLVDRSGSMREPIGTDRKFTRLDAAKEQLARVVTALPDTHHVNLIAYETRVRPLWDGLRRLSEENRAELLKATNRLALGAGTNIFESLEKAFEDRLVDTIYLLTDGTPTSGRVTAAEEILEEIRRWNRTRQIVIHCIGLGIDSDLLKRLAAENGGTYRYVR
jgi:hypothetical protein